MILNKAAGVLVFLKDNLIIASPALKPMTATITTITTSKHEFSLSTKQHKNSFCLNSLSFSITREVAQFSSWSDREDGPEN